MQDNDRHIRQKFCSASGELAGQDEEQLRSFVESSLCLYVRLDAGGHIQTISSLGHEMLQYPQDECLGNHYLLRIDKKDRGLAAQSFEWLMAGGETKKKIVLRLVRKDATPVWVEIHAFPILSDSGSIGVQALIRDISEQKKVQAELVTTKKLLAQAQKMSVLGALFTSVAHELSNQLCSVHSVLERFERTEDMGELNGEFLELALDQCHQMERLLKELHTFKSTDQGKVTVLDLHQVIDSVLLLFNKQLKTKRVKLRKEYHGALDCWGSEVQIKQVLLNIIQNSNEGMPATGGTISISTSQDKGSVSFTVRDTGIGIKKEDLARLCEPFFTTKTAVTGLGLSIAHEIVKGYQGEMFFDSEPGQGTSVTVILPDR